MLLQRNTKEYDSSLRLTNRFLEEVWEITCNYLTAHFFFHDHLCSGTYFKIKRKPNYRRSATVITNVCVTSVPVLWKHKTVVCLGQKSALLKCATGSRHPNLQVHLVEALSVGTQLHAPLFCVPSSPRSSFQHGQTRESIGNMTSGDLEVGSTGG